MFFNTIKARLIENYLYDVDNDVFIPIFNNKYIDIAGYYTLYKHPLGRYAIIKSCKVNPGIIDGILRCKSFDIRYKMYQKIKEFGFYSHWKNLKDEILY